MAAERSEAVASGLSFSLVWSTLEIARTFAAHHRRRKAPREIRRGEAAPLKTAKEHGNKTDATAILILVLQGAVVRASHARI